MVVKEVFIELERFGRLSGCLVNIDKTKCILLGKAIYNDSLRYMLRTVYGKDFLQNDFVALGINFNNHQSLVDITLANYLAKIDKAKQSIAIWSKRDLTLMGKCTIIKSLAMSQFSYLSIPLLEPSTQTSKNIERLCFNFLWSGKNDKIKRDIICRPNCEGGLDLFYPGDFISSLKLTLFSKLLNPNFSHAWKDLVINQLKFPSTPIICIENNLTTRNTGWAHNFVQGYIKWRDICVSKDNSSINHCIWNNSMIPPIGNPIKNDYLIDNNVYYISDFLDLNDHNNCYHHNDFYDNFYDYSAFLDKWQLNPESFSNRNYDDIISAIKTYNWPSRPDRNILNLAEDVTLRFFMNSKTVGGCTYNVKGRDIRSRGKIYHPPGELAPLVGWSNIIGLNNIEWGDILYNIFNIARNQKATQFQYKLLMRISTCRYMRHKMGIDPNNRACVFCNSSIETLNHIFVNCRVSINFIDQVNSFICSKLHSDYRDVYKYLFINSDTTDSMSNDRKRRSER